MTKTLSRFNPCLYVLLSCLLTAMTDPTRPPDALLPPSKGIVAAGPLHLTAIFIYPDRRSVVINGKTLSIGDIIDEYTIINIQHDTVELKGSQGTTTVLNLIPEVKQVRAN